MFEMTPELQAELIKWFIGALIGAGSIISAVAWLIIRWFNNRMEDQKKTRDADRERERQQWQAELENQRKEFTLRYEEFKDDAKTKEELFSLNRANANSFEMVANSVDKLTEIMGGKLAENTAQIEIFSDQLQVVGSSNNELIRVVNTASEKVDALLERISGFFNDLLERDEATVAATTQSRQDILNAVRTMQKDMAILQAVKIELDTIKQKVSHLVDTQPLPRLDDNGNPADDSNNETDTNNQERKIS